MEEIGSSILPQPTIFDASTFVSSEIVPIDGLNQGVKRSETTVVQFCPQSIFGR